jgi:hypothetical protein
VPGLRKQKRFAPFTYNPILNSNGNLDKLGKLQEYHLDTLRPGLPGRPQSKPNEFTEFGYPQRKFQIQFSPGRFLW